MIDVGAGYCSDAAAGVAVMAGLPAADSSTRSLRLRPPSVTRETFRRSMLTLIRVRAATACLVTQQWTGHTAAVLASDDTQLMTHMSSYMLSCMYMCARSQHPMCHWCLTPACQ